MRHVNRSGWLLGAAMGLGLGLFLAGLWPEAPLHAAATDRSDQFALATGRVDDDLEAVYYLDFQTNRLAGAVLGKQTRKNFQSTFGADLMGDLVSVIRTKNAEYARIGRPPISTPASPQWLMVTGINDIRVTGRERPSRSAIYVAETSTGIVMAYIAPWSPDKHSADQPYTAKLTLWAADQFSRAITRGE